MAWRRQETSHYLGQCWPRSLPPYGVTRPEWVKTARRNRKADILHRNFQINFRKNCIMTEKSLKNVSKDPVGSDTSLRHIFVTGINSLRPRLNRRPFVDDIFKCIFLNENDWFLPRISLKFVPRVRINNIPALVQIMAWRRPGDKPLSEPMMVSLLTHICVNELREHKTHSWRNLKYTSPI